MKALLLSLFVILFAGLTSCQPDEKENQKIVSQLYTAINNHDWDLALSYLHENFTDHRFPPSPDNSPEAVIGILKEYLEKNPKTKFIVLQELIDGDQTAARVKFTLYDANGDSTVYCNYNFYSIKDGKLLDMWFTTAKLPVAR
jgi:predicted SnoaL-like aldol condensation-catalyzing enzyme